MNYFKDILKFAKPYWRYAYLNVFFNICYALFSTLTYISLIPMLNVLFRETERVYEKPDLETLGIKEYVEQYFNYFVTAQLENNGIQSVLIYLIGLIIIVALLKNLSNYLAFFFMTFFRNNLLTDLRKALYKKVVMMDIAFFSEKRKGDVMSRMSNDVLEVQQSFLLILELLVRDPITIIITFFMMFYISIELTIFVLIFIPVSGFIISKIGKSLRKKSTLVQEEQGAILSALEETLGGLRVIKSFNAEGIFYNKFKKNMTRYLGFINNLQNRYNLASPTSEFLGIVVIGILLWRGGDLVIVQQSINASSFIAYIALSYNILTPAKSMAKSIYEIKKGNAAAERILEILNQENTIKELKNPIEKSTFDNKIEIKNIDFGYRGKMLFEDFSLTIPKGKMLALIGQSGSGKTTIANLLIRFFDVSSGSIEIDSVKVNHMSKKTLHELIGIVSQESILFNDSIRNNIALGKPKASLEEVIEASKVANAYEFIYKLPDKFDENIGDAGCKLSGGQRQRLSIARAVLKNPPIMILDEATSALDTESEKLVQEALENMMKNRTSIVIAHRLSTIQKADVIIVLKEGEIIEHGNHAELIAKNGEYRKWIEMQSFQ